MMEDHAKTVLGIRILIINSTRILPKELPPDLIPSIKLLSNRISSWL